MRRTIGISSKQRSLLLSDLPTIFQRAARMVKFAGLKPEQALVSHFSRGLCRPAWGA
jgi:hypothetical protein